MLGALATAESTSMMPRLLGLWPSNCWACGRGLVGLWLRIGGPVAGTVAVDCLACGRRIAWPVAGEGNVGGTKTA